jgi:type II secretory pathway pseudopilin PulG
MDSQIVRAAATVVAAGAAIVYTIVTWRLLQQTKQQAETAARQAQTAERQAIIAQQMASQPGKDAARLSCLSTMPADLASHSYHLIRRDALAVVDDTA